MIMRRIFIPLLLAAMLASLVPSSSARAAKSPEEWAWVDAAAGREKVGDIDGAMIYWDKLVTSLKTHDFHSCGTYAQLLGRAYDQRGRYAEAVAAYETEFDCWGRFDDRAEWMLWDLRRHEQLKPEVRTFVARPAIAATSPPLARNEHRLGTLLGGTVDRDPAVNSDLSRVSTAYGKPYGMVLVYARWGETLPVVVTQNARTAGAALQIGWEPTQGLSAVKDDAYVRGFARSLKEYGLPVFLRYASEMNGAWTEWHGNPAQYRESFALIARIMREEASNVAMVWSPNYVGDTPHDAYYPGDAHVDWVGINLYHDAYFQGNPGASQMLSDIYYQGKRSNPLDKVKEIYQQYSQRKPIMISETGFGWATRSPFQREDEWAADAMRRFYSYLPLLYPRIKAVSYFNVDFNAYSTVPSASHYLVSQSPALTKAYRESTVPDWYLGNRTAQPSTYWHPLEQATLVGRTRVASYVNLGDAGVSRVEYLVDGVVKATATTLPWEAELDLSGLVGAHLVTVRAYDRSGRMAVETSRRYDASSIRVNLDGRLIDFDQPPVNIDSRVLVPARAILEALGAQISWEAETRTVVALKDGSTLRLQIGSTVPIRDGVPQKEIDVPAQIIGDRTLVPVRFVAENYSMDVDWDQATKTVIIRSKP